MSKPTSGAKQLRKWRKDNRCTLAKLGAKVGDAAGEQTRKWEIGDRPSLPIALAVNISVFTGLPLHLLMTRAQLKVAKLILSTLARGAA